MTGRPVRQALVVISLATALAVGVSAPAAAVTLGRDPGIAGRTGGAAEVAPAALRARPVATGLDFPAAFTFAPNGRIFYGERSSGEIRVINPETGRSRHFFTVSGVLSDGERGLLGVAVHPRYPDRPFVHAFATRDTASGTRNQIVRIRAEGGKATGMQVIFTTPAGVSEYHDGGRILFGPDRALYAVVGESHSPARAQDLGDPQGKLLRMGPAGGALKDNPFPKSRIFAYGIRNSFGFDFDPRNGRLWATEAGPTCNDELNRIPRGRNMGWGPSADCDDGPSPRNTNQDGPNPVLPKRWYSPPITPTGVAFCRRCGLGRGNEGRLFFGAWNTGEIRRVTLNDSRGGVRRVSVAYEHDDGVISLEAGPRGAIYFSDLQGIYRLAEA